MSQAFCCSGAVGQREDGFDARRTASFRVRWGRSGRHQSPPHQFHRRQRWCALRCGALMENHRRHLRRRDVVTRTEERYPRHDDADQLDQLAEIFRCCVTPAHASTISQDRDKACPPENFSPPDFRPVPAAGEQIAAPSGVSPTAIAITSKSGPSTAANLAIQKPQAWP